MKISITVLAVAALLIAATGGQAADPEPRKRCGVVIAQGLTQVKGLSCRGARKIARAYYRADLPKRPECRGQGSIRWNGWKVTGVGTLGIATKLRKGKRSFVLSGGGTC